MLHVKKLKGGASVSDEASHQHPNQREPTNPFMPVEVLVEILSRIPVKSLLKFRSVSKSWLALISSPEFIKSHLKISVNNNTNLRVMDESDLDYLMERSGISLSIQGSVNGLIFLVNRENELFVWNPTIRKYKKLPDYRTEPRHDNRFTYGFGYDEIHDDYKVVQIFTNNGPLYNFHEVTMYSLKNNSWRRVNCPQNEARLISTGKFVNGKLYWPTTVGLDPERVWSITSFDLAHEKWRKVERPCGDDVLVLEVLGSNLSMICNNSTTNIDVWAMKEYEDEESWMKMFTINHTPDLAEYFLSQSFFLSKRGEFLLMFKATYKIFNPIDNSVRYSQLSNFIYDLLADFYTQSLVCPLSQN